MIKMNWGPVLTWSIDNHGLMKSVWGGLASALQMIDDFDTSDTEGSSMGRLQVWGLYGMANFNPYDEHSPSVCKTYFFTRQTPNCTPWSGLGQGQKLFLSINQIIVLLKSSPYHMTFMNIIAPNVWIHDLCVKWYSVWYAIMIRGYQTRLAYWGWSAECEWFLASKAGRHFVHTLYIYTSLILLHFYVRYTIDISHKLEEIYWIYST